MRAPSVVTSILGILLTGIVPCQAEEILAGTVIAGTRATDVRSVPVTVGKRVQAASTVPTEISFADGTSLVLGPGADLTITSITRDSRSGNWLINGESANGAIRILTPARTTLTLRTPIGDILISGSSALLSGGPNASVTLLSTGHVEVRRNNTVDILERPGFRMTLVDGVITRESSPQLRVTLEPFVPVQPSVRAAAQDDCAGDACAATPAAYVQNQNKAVSYNSNQSATPGNQTGSITGPSGIATSLARTELAQSNAAGSSFAAPGPNSDTISIDTTAFSITVDGRTVNVANATVGVERRRFGQGRIRRFAAGQSGFPAGQARTDTGVITFPSGAATSNSFFQNLTAAPLATDGTFYDGIANVGSAMLVLDVGQTTVDGALSVLYQTLPRLSITDTSGRPYVVQDPFNTSVSPATPGEKHYYGSAVFENRVSVPVPVNGTVGSLQGELGRMVLLTSGNSDQYFPSVVPTPDTGGLSVGPPGLPNPRASVDKPSPDPLPTVYIIDKIHTENPPIDPTQTDNFDPRGIDPGERYFIIGGTPIQPVAASQGLPGAPPGTIARFAISDGLDPQSFDGTGQFSIADQFLGRTGGGSPIAFSRFNGFRPEETFVAGAPRGDTHLLVLSSADGRNPALRSDLQIADDGTSSMSVSAGGISNLSGTLMLSGATVGSANLNSSNTRGVMSITANLGSLGTDSSGVGAHMFAGSNQAPGQIGFFAVGQADTRLGAPGTPEGIQPGVLQTIDSNPSTAPFAYTRLATNVGAPVNRAPVGRLDHDGFATGLVLSVASGQSTLYAVSSAQLGDVRIVSNAANTEFAATLGLNATAVGSLSFDVAAVAPPNGQTGRKTISIGNAPGPVPTTAVVSTATFGGVVPGRTAIASVDRDTIQGIANRTGTIKAPSGPTVDASLPSSNEHLAWGLFVSDLPVSNPTTERNYAGMGFWVAGRPVSLTTLQTLTGTATYAGGMVGAAAQQVGAQTQIRTVTGQFAQTWDFARRSGSINARFDGANWNGVAVSMPLNRNDFGGAGAADNGRILTVQGAFFNNGTPVSTPQTALSAPNTPAGVGGVFGIKALGYGANGVFVGGRR